MSKVIELNTKKKEWQGIDRTKVEISIKAIVNVETMELELFETNCATLALEIYDGLERFDNSVRGLKSVGLDESIEASLADMRTELIPDYLDNKVSQDHFNVECEVGAMVDGFFQEISELGSDWMIHDIAKLIKNEEHN